MCIIVLRVNIFSTPPNADDVINFVKTLTGSSVTPNATTINPEKKAKIFEKTGDFRILSALLKIRIKA